MSWHAKDNGVWKEVVDPHVKSAGVWVPVQEGWVRNAGVWKRFYLRDTVPPADPTVSMTRPNNTTFTITVGGSDATASHYSVWARKTYSPPAVEGNDYQLVAKKVFNYGGTNQVTWTVSQTEGATYYCKARVYDTAGNGSSNVEASKVVPVTTNYYTDYIDPVSSDSWRVDTDGWRTDNNDVYQGGTNAHKGCWFYGTRLDKLQGMTITKLRIKISRKATEHGVAGPANVRLARHDNKEKPAGNPGTMYDPTKVGELNRGENDWFNVPSGWWSGIENGGTQYRGFGLYTSNVGVVSSDYLIANAAADSVNCGRIYVEYHD